MKGQGEEGDVLDHRLTLSADRFTPVDSGLIPTGELRSVKGTPFDFTTPVAIGARINNDDEQLTELGKGYDHNWVLNRKAGDTLSLAAKSRRDDNRTLDGSVDNRTGEFSSTPEISWTANPGKGRQGLQFP